MGASPAKKLSKVVEHKKELSSESEQKASSSLPKAATSRKSSKLTGDVVCVDSDLNLSSCGSSESVEIIRSEETAGWAEVYLSAEVPDERIPCTCKCVRVSISLRRCMSEPVHKITAGHRPISEQSAVMT